MMTLPLFKGDWKTPESASLEPPNLGVRGVRFVESSLRKICTGKLLTAVDSLGARWGIGFQCPILLVSALLESDTTERLYFHFSLSCIGEGNGSPVQCSCLENPRDGGAWWAAICGVTQSRTRLKRLRSSSSSVT